MISELIGYNFYRDTYDAQYLHFLTVVLFEQFLPLLLICNCQVDGNVYSSLVYFDLHIGDYWKKQALEFVLLLFTNCRLLVFSTQTALSHLPLKSCCFSGKVVIVIATLNTMRLKCRYQLTVKTYQCDKKLTFLVGYFEPS